MRRRRLRTGDGDVSSLTLIPRNGDASVNPSSVDGDMSSSESLSESESEVDELANFGTESEVFVLATSWLPLGIPSAKERMHSDTVHCCTCIAIAICFSGTRACAICLDAILATRCGFCSRCSFPGRFLPMVETVDVTRPARHRRRRLEGLSQNCY